MKNFNISGVVKNMVAVFHQYTCLMSYVSFLFFGRCAQLFDVSEAAFLQATEDVMLTLIDNVSNFIRWPAKHDYPQLADKFNDIGKGLVPFCSSSRNTVVLLK